VIAILLASSGCATTAGEGARIQQSTSGANRMECRAPVAPTHELDASRSSIDVAGADRVTGEHVGRIHSMQGSLELSPQGVPTAMRLVVDLKSLRMNNESVESFVKSDDFLAVGRYPTATFVACEVKKTQKPGELLVIGMLSLHGVERRIEHRATLTREGDDVIVHANYRLPRHEFGIESDGFVDSFISPHVRVKLALRGSRIPSAAQPAKRSVAEISSWRMPGSNAE
jgi:polyisoprenoid-binding protein YceI